MAQDTIKFTGPDSLQSLINVIKRKTAPKVHTHSVSDIEDFPESMPASDVSDWAKASTKPTYTANEVGAAPTVHTHSVSDIENMPKGRVNNSFSVKPSVRDHTEPIKHLSVIFNQDFYYKKFWTDGDDLYCSWGMYADSYIFNKSKNIWEPITFNVNIYADYIWSDGNNTYYSNGNTQYVFDKSTKRWNTKTWNFEEQYTGTRLSADSIIKVGNDIYFSFSSPYFPGNPVFILDKNTDTWILKEWTNIATNDYSMSWWTDGSDLYYSGHNDHSKQYILNKTIDDWVEITGGWNIDISRANEMIWTDGTRAFYTSSDTVYMLDKSNNSWIEKPELYINRMNEMIPGKNTYIHEGNLYINSYFNSCRYRFDKDNDLWVPEYMLKYIDRFDSFYGERVWSDGENVYYSSLLMLDKLNNVWVFKNWSGLSDFSGDYIWSDGENIYYSRNASTQYILNKATDEWVAKDWGDKKPEDGSKVWTDGKSIYYSEGTNQYVLDKSTGTWVDKTWGGLSNLNGSHIWSDGENVYSSFYTGNQYILDKATDTWVAKEWGGLSDIVGNKVWFDGENIRYQNSHILDRNTDTWIAQALSGSFDNPWTDGENVYLGYEYIFKKGKNVKLH